jgi:hypothetical protein
VNGDLQQEELRGWVKVRIVDTHPTPTGRRRKRGLLTLEDVRTTFPNISPQLVFAVPGTEKGIFVAFASDIPSIRNSTCGLEVVIVGPYSRPPQPQPRQREGGQVLGPTTRSPTPPPIFTPAPAFEDPPAMRTARASQTREELARNLSSIRSRITNIVPADVLQGNVSLTDDGKIKVAEKQKRVYRKASEKLKEKLVNPKFNSGIAERIADCLLLKTGGLATQLTNEVASLRVQQVKLNVELSNKASVFQLEHFVNSCVAPLKEKLTRGSTKRKKTFKQLSSLLNMKPRQMEEDFIKIAESFIDSCFGATSARTVLQETITKLVTTSGLLEAKSIALSKIGTDWKSEILLKVTEHLTRIAEADFVKKISFSNDTLTVLVGPSVVKYSGQKYFVGDLEIRLHLTVTEGRHIITFYNTTIGTASEYHYPHIQAYGESVCWGTAFESAHNLFSDWNWTVLIGFLWKFLTTYNDKSKFKPLPDVSIIAVREAKKNGIPIPEDCVGA